MGTCVQGILNIVRSGLCHRCGACVGVCPADTLALDAEGYPEQVAGCVSCGVCTTICSGVSVDYPSLGQALVGPDYRYGAPLGCVQSAHIAHATDADIRWHGASGGVVTQLLKHLLDTGQIRGALVVAQSDEDPSLGRGIIARSSDALAGTSQSRYTTTPSLAALKEIRREDGPYAVVAVPCQAHAIRRLQALDPVWAERVSLVIGLLCHFNLPCTATREAAALANATGQRLTRTQYRQSDDSGWPYDTVEFTFGRDTVWRSPFGPAETVTLLGRLYPLGRCLWCLDAAAELADLAVGDPWIRGEDGTWKYCTPEGRSSVIVRTKRGGQALESARDAGCLVLQTIDSGEIQTGQRGMIMEKKERVPARLAWRRLVRRPIPDYPMPLPAVSLRRMAGELPFFASRLIPACRPLRRLLLRLALSRAGQALVRLRNAQKKRRHTRRQGRKAGAPRR